MFSFICCHLTYIEMEKATITREGEQLAEFYNDKKIPDCKKTGCFLETGFHHKTYVKFNL